MRYIALATDYDGTLASHGRVLHSTVQAIKDLRSSGRKTLLVTGRELHDLEQVFSDLDLFDRVVAENGALLYRPATRERVTLAEPPPPPLIARLQELGVPFSIGRSILATNEPHEVQVLHAIKELGLEWHLIFNKGSVMVLPTGVNKATGLHRALAELGISEHNVVAVGDAENDNAFLAACEFGVAVANALPTLKEKSDLVTSGARGTGVEELVAEMLRDDLQSRELSVRRHALRLGHSPADESDVMISPFRGSILIAGPSGSGKSSVATVLLERLLDRKYQFCLIDPEGDYDNLPGTIALGTASSAPTPGEVLQALGKPKQSVVVNLLATAVEDRPVFCAALLPRLLEMRSRTARPHFIFIDEAHHLLPSNWHPAPNMVPQAISGFVMVTVRPDSVARAALEGISTVIATGPGLSDTLGNFARTLRIAPPPNASAEPAPNMAAIWHPHEPAVRLEAVAIEPTRAERRRHTRKYAEGELPPDRSFYFRGPEKKLNLRARNLMTFVQIADGVDDETWAHHLRAGDYSRWLREYIKDHDLASEVAAAERDPALDSGQSRRQVREAIERRYTASADLQ